MVFNALPTLPNIALMWYMSDASSLYLSYLVGDGRGEAIMWPFQSIDATPDDIADAISPAYQTWRLSPGLPICDSPKAFGDRKATVLSLPATDSRLIPLSRQLPVTGPYQIVLPAWIDTDNLFFSRGDRLL
ncbi:hypothetical protein BFJ68_g446 [Fusarium oxysporum]|uniref:Uncharacterized protein n=2 Tax=Fusarium oxysporum TaxID=5507 RepID=A0A420S9F0_FUSOX|nr:hypothetical protein BFJ65_g11523 [Fusarium oxysporum f. sp. cepae]RKK56201.1 hypothetical protein BFJ66_g3818 [Fusarium oxysporum f. sp. cepae]RKK60065.1 hypothetical protein BFJ67_g2398 [Fusarium oxysporum f. sp. cepae]RKL25819.1 hypothetical protein BFJ68_g446 [Fusarium oxysporum]